MTSRPPKKILCTLGPSSLNERTIKRLEELGVDLFRLNLSHLDTGRIRETVELIRSHSKVPICLDSQGAQVRTGRFAAGTIRLGTHAIVELGREIPLYPPDILSRLQVGDLLSIDFDAAVIQVIQIKPTYLARVLNGGLIGSNKAISFDHPVPLSPFTESDLKAFALGKKLGIHHVALSFTNQADDIKMLHDIVGKDVEIIAKIETQSAMENLGEILQQADGVLIDRGDLSREIPLERIPLAQKEIIRKANAARVPVYVATNLLESMVTAPYPTRAEVNDVMNTLLDGADGLVLAAETAIGKFPVECVQMIRSLITQYESSSFPLRLEKPQQKKTVKRRITDRDAKLPHVEIDGQAWIDIRLMTSGVFSPLNGFMVREELESVLLNSRLPSGPVWPVPVLLQVPAGKDRRLPTAQDLVLTIRGEGRALLHLEQTFSYDIDELAQKWFGTSDRKHPGVAALFQRGDLFLGGSVELLDNGFERKEAYDMDPAQMRFLLRHLRWQKLIGLQADPTIGPTDEHLIRSILDDHRFDGLFIHVPESPLPEGYLPLVKNHSGRVVLAGSPNYSRFSESREALLAAICHKNFGCSHFVVSSARMNDRRFRESVESIGISPVSFDEL